jgi:hypothetical protein
MGRPKKPAAQRRSIEIVMRVTPGEKTKLVAAAAKMGLPLASATRLLTLEHRRLRGSG